MKHAYLIMAHGSQDELVDLLQALDDKRNDLWIHIDKTSDIDINKILSCTKYSKVNCISRKKISWGGFSIIDAELRLFEEAHDSEHYSYYHLLSGLDFPTKNQDYIHSFFDKHAGQNFIRQVTYDNYDKFVMRYDQYHLFQDSLIGKKRNFWKYLDFSLCYFQKFIGISRFRERNMRAAIQWVSVTNQLVEFLLSKKNQILRDYRWTYCCDEVFLMSEIAGTKFESTISAEYGNLRYIKWQWYSKHDYSPRTLTIDDFDLLADPHILFARKFINPKSSSLKIKLKESWL